MKQQATADIWERSGHRRALMAGINKSCPTFFCSNSLPLVSIRWVRSKFQASAQFSLSSAIGKSQTGKIEITFQGTQRIEPMAAGWEARIQVTSVLCSPLLLPNLQSSVQKSNLRVPLELVAEPLEVAVAAPDARLLHPEHRKVCLERSQHKNTMERAKAEANGLAVEIVS